MVGRAEELLAAPYKQGNPDTRGILCWMAKQLYRDSTREGAQSILVQEPT